MDHADQQQLVRERLAVLAAENARLRASEEKSHFLFDTMAQGIIVQDAESRIVEANLAACDILGLSKDQLLGKTTFDPRWKLIHEDGSTLTTDEMPSNIALRTGKSVTNVVGGVYLPEIDQIHWIIINAVPKFQAGDTTPSYTITTFTDITERKQTLDALAQSEHRLRALIEHSPFGALEYELHDDGRLVFIGWNEAANRILAVDCAGFMGKTIEEAFPPLVKTSIPDAYRRVAAYGESYDDEQLQYDYGHITGTYELYAFQTSPQHMAVFFRDITKRKQAEEALLQRTRQLSILGQAGRNLNDVLELPIVMRSLVQVAMELVCASSGAAGRYQDGEMVFTEYCEQDNVLPIDLRFPPDYGVPGWVITHRQPYWTNDAEHDPQVVPEIQQGLNFYNLIDTPIIGRSGELLGCFEMHNKADHAPFTPADVSLLEALASSAAVAFENAQLVAQLHAAEAEVRTERDQSQRYLDIAGVMIVVIDSNQHVTLINKMGCEVLGYSPAEIIGRNWYQTVVPANVRAQEEELFRKLIAEEVTPIEHCESIVQTKNGTEKLIAWHNTVLRDEVGRIIGTLSSGEDVTERKQAEDKTRQLAIIVENSRDFIGVATLDQRAIYVNRAGQQLVGLDENTFRETQIDNYFMPEDLPFVHETIIPAMLRDGSWSGEFRLRHFKTGQPIPVFYDLFRVEDVRTGEPTCFATITRDITERKRDEQLLRNSEARWRSILTSAPTGIGMVNDRVLLEVNDQILRMTGYSREELIGQNSRIFYPTQEDYDAVGKFKYAQIREKGTGSVETRWQRKDGRVFDVLLSSTPIDPHNLSAGITFTALDITAQKEADRAKNQFLMVLSHEMKTPLTSILGWANAAVNMPEQTQQALEIIIRNAKEQSRILEDLLDVSRLVTGRLTLKADLTDLNALAQACVESTQPSAQANSLTLVSAEITTTPLPIVADPGRIQQAINNLLTNAIKFTESGGQIRVRTFRRDDMAVLEVQDTGRGIAPDEVPRLFRPFLQLKREEQKGGLGLGLSLVKGIIELHHGQVQVASPGEGQGSTFTISLPLRTA